MEPLHTTEWGQFVRRIFAKKTNLLGACLLLATTMLFVVVISGCDSEKSPTIGNPISSQSLEVQDVQTIITQAVEQAERLDEKVVVAVTDREANILGVFRMNGSTGSVEDPIVGAVAKARTTSYLSSNQHGFTTLTACFITRKHFPPDVSNTPAGPLFGVPFSSLGGGDIQPNDGAIPGVPGNGQPGLTGVPGGVPIFKNGLLAGGVGISGGTVTQQLVDDLLDRCAGVFKDESIALGAVLGYSVPEEKRGDNIFLDGIRLLYANTEVPPGNFTLSFADLASRGVVDSRFPIRATPAPKFPGEGPVNLDASHDFRVLSNGKFLTTAEIQRIINQAAAQANKTRAAIRRPIGSPARVFISVVDVDGRVLGIWRTPDATLFSFDVSAQKARTALAFSDPSHELGKRIRAILGLSPDQGFAISTRAVGFLSQDFYPPGIDEETLDQPVEPGPLFEGPEFQLQARLGLQPYGNGITIFPGGIPLYKNGPDGRSQLAGAIGISGDGVDQDDIIAFAGAVGFEPPPEIRSDQFSFKDVRLPYVKFPRQPELD
jgi:uncharacterized protein GlcG (DUF336 family)